MVKKFAVFDIDGTIFRWQLYHELFDALIDEGIIDGHDAAKVLEAREQWRQRHLDYHDYELTLMDVMEEAIVGLENDRFHEIAATILRKKGHRVYTYTLELLHTLQQQGYVAIAISASHQHLVEAFCKLHNIDIAIGRKFEIIKGKIGKKSEDVHGRKHVMLQRVIQEQGLTLEDSYAVGDSGGDISMLAMVENPIAFNPNQELKDEAMKHGWPIVIERKSIAYRLEKGSDGSYVLAETNS